VSSSVHDRRSSVVVIGGLALALAGCGGGSIAADDVESTAVDQFSQQFEVQSVDCPEDLPAEVGAETTCVLVDGAGGQFEMTATVTAVEGDEADFDLELTAEL
jgi:hypothetical protein